MLGKFGQKIKQYKKKGKSSVVLQKLQLDFRGSGGVGWAFIYFYT